MKSAKHAAQIATTTLNTSDLRAHTLSQYEKLWKQDFGKNIRFFTKAAKLLGKRSENLVKINQPRY